MLLNERFLELKTLFTPSKSIEQLSENVVNELLERLKYSKDSMIYSGQMKKIDKLTSSENLVAIDFGGTSLKMAIIDKYTLSILFIKTSEIHSNIVNLEFFDNSIKWVCDQIHEFINTHPELKGANFPVGITFSFPLNNNSEVITMGKLFVMTEETEKKNLYTIIKVAFSKFLDENYPFQVELQCIINDSVAVYLSSRLHSSCSNFSLILGTGINSCICLPYHRVPKMKIQHEYDFTNEILINTEIGFLGQGYFPLSHFEKFENLGTSPPMFLEYITSGKYIPLTLKNILEYYKLYSSVKIEFNGEFIKGILCGNEFGFGDAFPIVLWITKLLLNRSAWYLCAVIKGIDIFINERPSESIIIGYVGSFLRNCTYYQEQVKIYSQNKIDFVFLRDSNLIGAAIAAIQEMERLK